MSSWVLTEASNHGLEGNSGDPLYHDRFWEYQNKRNAIAPWHHSFAKPALQPRRRQPSTPATRHNRISGLAVNTVVIPTGNGFNESRFCCFDLLPLLLASQVGMHVYRRKRLAIKKPLRLVAAEVS